MDIMDGMSLNIEQTNKEKLQAVFPECFSEDVLDIDKLLSLCGEYITNDFEKYKFEWKGKSECLQLAQKRSMGTLRPVKDESINFDTTQNVYIKGDNLEVLKLLQTAYYRKIKMIYIDPPYNTGNDFVYEDDFADPMARYKEVTQQTTKSNPETMGRFHTNWLNMMYPRLMLASNLLTDDGVIFISIDDNEITNLRKLCNEVFGEENFVATLTVIVKPEGRRYGHFAKTHEYILVYAKQIETLTMNEVIVEGAEYQYFDDIGGFNLKGLRNRNVQAFNSSNRPNLRYPFYVDIDNPNKNGLCTVSVNKVDRYVEVYPSTINGLESVWRWGREKAENEIEKLTAYKGNDNEIRIFQKERKLTQTAKTVLSGKEIISNKGTKELQELLGKGIFDFPKPLKLVKMLTSIGMNENDLILDFFSGSATTAHAAMQLNAEDGGNRKFICVQLPELTDENSEAYKAGYKTICDIGMERIRRAGQKILKEFSDNEELGMRNEELKQSGIINEELGNEKEETNPNSKFLTPNSSLDLGFKVFELDTSNLKTWDSTLSLDDYAQEEIIERMKNILSRVKTERTALDMVYEIMLKIGKPLTDTVEAFEIDGKTAYSIGEDGNLIICLAKDVTPEYLEKLCELKPSKLVVGKDALFNDTAMSNALYICQDRNIELKLV
ncbi:MAG: site-specific DNA-methyltransferase [Clostridia bacterium]|nr:site-specific DNA-methyltransferase [Clostridia bacterium]